MQEHITALMARPEIDAREVEVQHLLVSFAGSGVPTATRSREEAESLAAQLFTRIQEGADFGALIEKYTDDSPPGIYGMTQGEAAPGLYPRRGMVAAFGDVGWRLSVGEVGVAPYDPEKSPFGWHLIKRLK